MTDRQKALVAMADKTRQLVLAAERDIWAHPEVGYTEWWTNQYMIGKFEALGYELVRADQDERFGKIPGFCTDVKTGRPGPTVAIFGEMDALDIASHPESVNGMTHCCGHNAQAAYLLGLAAALKEPGALDGLCGTIRLIAVPAEEMIQLAYREELRKKGVIKYMGGKTEFMYRGFLDGVDMAMMIHAGISKDGEKSPDFVCGYGANGCMAKTFTYTGKSAHAGCSPCDGHNAEYAAMLGLNACNALRETFRDEDHVRFHPIVHGVNCAVNIIPDEIKLESYVRASSLEAIKEENIKVNRALASGALAMGCGLTLCDRPGYAPEMRDRAFMKLVEGCCIDLSGEDKVAFDYNGWSTGSSDFGDITCVMPGVQMDANGCTGNLHGTDFYVTDPEKVCMNSVRVLLLVCDELLKNDGARALEICKGFQPRFASIQDYLDFIDGISLDAEAVTYDKEGRASLNYMK